jgi:hypothetical protein
MDQLTTFRQSLAEAIAWCTAHATLADPEWSLRTSALDPGPLSFDLSLIERQAYMATVVQARSHLLRDAGLHSLMPATDLAGGRLLLFDLDGSASDGAAANDSRGFFDDDNVPPWDCWVLYVADPLTADQQASEQAYGRRLGYWSAMPPTSLGACPRLTPPYHVVNPIPAWRVSYLVSRVPSILIPLAQNGVDANPEECIEWLADRDTPFTRALQELHLLH